MQLPGERVPAWIVMFILTRELAITGLRGIAAAQGVVIDAGQEGKIKTVFVTVGTCALIMHYDYYIDVGFYQGVISCMEIGLLMTYISLAYSTISAFDYTRLHQGIGTDPPRFLVQLCLKLLNTLDDAYFYGSWARVDLPLPLS